MNMLDSPARRRTTKRESRLRFETFNAFVDSGMSTLSRAELALWLILYRDARGDVAQTSQADLARRAGVCKRTVSRAVRRLVARGLLVVTHRGSVREGPSAYRVSPLELGGG